ncbi:MAG: hypothetical protein ABI867_06130 [Kofleriaceae bacterium]
MGLEWEPLATPVRGYEQEFENLFRKLAGTTGARRAQLLEWFAKVADPPFATIGAPRVGYDEAADAWLRSRLEKSNRLEELEQISVEMRGYNVLELMPPCEGFPVYSNHIIDDNLDRYSFNAELLADESEELGTELFELAYTMMLPDDHRDFGEKLLFVASRFMRDNHLSETVETIREPVFPEGSIERRGHVLFAAAKWSLFWSQRGYGLAVSY